jgi:adenosine deaminase
MTDSAAYGAYLDRMPKTDIHVHLTGTVRASTFAELAAREGLQLPGDPLEIFANINSRPPDPELYVNTRIPVPQGPSPDEPEVSYSLFKASEWALQCLRSADDVTRIVYEAFEDAHASATRHLELFFDELPPSLTHLGYNGYVQAMAGGIRRASQDFGMTGLLIAGIDRSQSGEHALALVQNLIDNPHPDVVGIGLDNLETSGPPERFEAAYQLAGRHGLKRTAHSSEHAPLAKNTITCLDVLGCDRIDHGYFVLEDDAVVARVRAQQVAFTGIFTTSRRSWRPWRRASIKAMADAGLKMVIASDDPGMFPTTLAAEYRIAAFELGFPAAKMREIALNGVDACWLPEAGKAKLRERFVAELDALEAELFEGSQLPG